MSADTFSKVNLIASSSNSDSPLLKLNKETGKYYMNDKMIAEYRKADNSEIAARSKEIKFEHLGEQFQ